MRGHEHSLVRDHGIIYDGMRELLEFLRHAEWELALCTNSSEAYVENVLSGLDLSSLFEFIRYKSEGKSKVDNVRELVVGRSSLSVMIGDRKGDIDAALENGIISIAVLWGYGFKSELEGAAFTTSSVENLKEIFIDLGKRRGISISVLQEFKY